MLTRFALILSALAFTTAAVAQTAQPANPLQPRPARPAAAPAPAAAAPAAATPAATAKPKRERSPAQLANDDRMRKCGAEWRANKASLEAQGQKWRSFSTACRARLKAAGQ
jgi:hypothetical protein